MQDLAKYSYVNAKVRGMLSCLLTKEKLASLSEVKDIYALFDGLKQTGYQDLLPVDFSLHLDLRTLEKKFLESALLDYQKLVMAFKSRREKEFANLLLESWQIKQLKTALRIWQQKSQDDYTDFFLKINICNKLDFNKIVQAINLEEIIVELKDTPYPAPLLKAREKFKERSSVFYLEAELDRDYYQRLAHAALGLAAYDRRVVLKLLGIEIDLENINWFLRLSKYYAVPLEQALAWFIPGGYQIKPQLIKELYAATEGNKENVSAALGKYAKLKNLAGQNISFIEQFLYDIFSNEIRQILCGYPFTLGVSYAYFVLKRQEIKTLISLLYAKNLAWDKGQLKTIVSEI